LLWLSHLKLA